MPWPNFARFLVEAFMTTLTSAIAFSTLIAEDTIAFKARSTTIINPADAPKAMTRAFEASKDLLNSSALTVALESPDPKARALSPPPPPPKAFPMVFPMSPNLRLIFAISRSACLVASIRSTVILSLAIFLRIITLFF